MFPASKPYHKSAVLLEQNYAGSQKTYEKIGKNAVLRLGALGSRKGGFVALPGAPFLPCHQHRRGHGNR
jgi:hypothetical protein